MSSRASSRQVRIASWILRSSVRRCARNAFLTSCWLIVEPPRASLCSRRSISKLLARSGRGRSRGGRRTGRPRRRRTQPARSTAACGARRTRAGPCRPSRGVPSANVCSEASASVVTSAAGGSAVTRAAVVEVDREVTPSPAGRPRSSAEVRAAAEVAGQRHAVERAADLGRQRRRAARRTVRSRARRRARRESGAPRR